MSYRFTIVKKGYNPEEVDNFIQGLESALKNYKEKEVAIKNALINAQVAADRIIEEAHGDVIEMKRNTLYQLEIIKKTVEEQKVVLSSFQEDYKRLIRKYLQDINTSEFELLVGKIDALAGNVQDLIHAAEGDKLDQYRPDLVSTRVFGRIETQQVQERLFPAHTKEETPIEEPLSTKPPKTNPSKDKKSAEKPIGKPTEKKEETNFNTIKGSISEEENEALRGLFK